MSACVALALTQATLAGAEPSDPSWQTYHSDRGGFSMAVPGGWTVQETTEPGGTLVNAHAGAEGVAVHLGAADELPADLPNTACGPLAVAGLSGTRCADTLSRSVSVTFGGPNGTVRITTSRLLDPAVFDQILGSFALDVSLDTSQAVPDQGGLTPAPLAPPAVDRCALWVGPTTRARPLCPPP